jgi:hypothetical protein
LVRNRGAGSDVGEAISRHLLARAAKIRQRDVLTTGPGRHEDEAGRAGRAREAWCVHAPDRDAGERAEVLTVMVTG